MINSLGYALLGAGRLEEAIAIFEYNAGRFPKSANCLDSLAEGWLKKGDRDKGGLDNNDLGTVNILTSQVSVHRTAATSEAGRRFVCLRIPFWVYYPTRAARGCDFERLES